MGIKFRCPSGHKLNVKSFLSGKRAICPKCGAKVIVPSVEGAVAGVAVQPIDEDEEPTSQVELPERERMAGAAEARVNGSRSADSQSADLKSAYSQSAGRRGRVAAADPLAEAPAASWYVRPPSGGQFGPAPGTVLRAWLDEGRVTANSLVWREGWEEWQMAASVFPRLAVAVGAPSLDALSTPGRADAPNDLPSSFVRSSTGSSTVAAATRNRFVRVAEDASEDPAVIQRRRRERDQRNMILASVVLLIVVVVLFIALLVVLNQRGADSDSAVLRSLPPSAICYSPQFG